MYGHRCPRMACRHADTGFTRPGVAHLPGARGCAKLSRRRRRPVPRFSSYAACGAGRREGYTLLHCPHAQMPRSPRCKFIRLPGAGRSAANRHAAACHARAACRHVAAGFMRPGVVHTLPGPRGCAKWSHRCTLPAPRFSSYAACGAGRREGYELIRCPHAQKPRTPRCKFIRLPGAGLAPMPASRIKV